MARVISQSPASDGAPASRELNERTEKQQVAADLFQTGKLLSDLLLRQFLRNKEIHNLNHALVASSQ